MPEICPDRLNSRVNRLTASAPSSAQHGHERRHYTAPKWLRDGYLESQDVNRRFSRDQPTKRAPRSCSTGLTVARLVGADDAGPLYRYTLTKLSDIW